MTPPGSSRVGLGIRLSSASAAKLDRLAGEAGMKRSAVAAALLEELLPTIASVRSRLQVVRSKPEQ